jgi:HK97 family phage major capsid protein
MSFAEVKQAVDQMGEAWEQYKATNDARVEALKAGQAGTAAALEAKLSKIDADLTKLGALKRNVEQAEAEMRERIEELESKAKLPQATKLERAEGDYKGAFVGWLRSRCQSPEMAAKMNDALRAIGEAKAINIATPADGGYAVPEEIARTIEKLEKRFSPVRSLVKVVPTMSSDYKELVSLGGASSGWVGESTTRTETNTPLLRERVPTFGELYAYPQVSEWSLDDVFFNVEQWLSEEVAEEFAIQEADAVIRGNASNKPTGMLNTAPVATADGASPLRNASAFQFIESAASPAPAITADALIDLVYALNSRYRAAAVWTMNSLTTGAVRKLKDLQGQYLWAPGLAGGQPDRLLGFEVATWEQMDDIGANAHPIGFGNWRRAYMLADRVGMRVTRDNVTRVGFVKFYVRRREGGNVLNNDAVKFLKTT